MKRIALVLALIVLVASRSSAADDKIRIGIVGQFSGPFALSGAQFRTGVETWIAQHGTKVGGRDVEVIYRDTGGPNPASARRIAEELIVQDKVSMLGGFYLSPEAVAVASLVTETKTPAVLFETGSPPVVTLSPYFVRTGNSIGQGAQAEAVWGYKHGKRRAYMVVSDYAPGYDVEGSFKKNFTALGGTVIGDDRAPLNTVDYAPFAERIANANPDLVVVFIPSGAPAISMMKALQVRGVTSKAVVIGQAEADDPELSLYDDTIVGFYSALHYALGINNAENKRFRAAVRKTAPAAVPSFLMVGAYDGMRVMYKMIESQKGKPWNSTAAVDAVKGYTFDSPRGQVRINSITRDINQPYFIRRVGKADGHLENILVETLPVVTETTHSDAAPAK
jgi:branched-chain amino acid transport system substrate-binding protein